MDEEEKKEETVQATDQLSVEQLQEELATVTKKWYEFGQNMGLRSTQLHMLERGTGRDPEYYFKEMLTVLVEDEELKVTWGKIVDALRAVGEKDLSLQLAGKYGVVTGECGEEGEGEGGGEGEGEGEKTVPNLKTQKEEIHALLNQKLKKGDTWYLVDVRWMKMWKKYTGYDTWDQGYSGQQAYFPGPLDTSNLFADGGNADSLKEHLMEELDYSLIPEPAWNKLVAWYGVSENSRPIARKVVEYGLYMKHSKVEVYLLNFKLCIHPKLTEHIVKSFSRADSISDLEKELCSIFNITEGTVCRVWHRYMSHTYELLNDPKQTLQDAGLYNMQAIVLECQKEDGTWPRSTREAPYPSAHSTRSQDPVTGSSASSSYSSSSSYRGGGSSFWNSSHHEPTHPGLCGLSNLGNTCFMNSALQCLSHTEPLTEYFMKGAFKKHVNKNNPLGMRGQVAETYGSLLDDLWSGKLSACSPRQFKTIVGKFAPQFSGYQQQDSHELLAFLLDGLHEDLNLVLKKPYVDMTIKTDGREDKDVAEESWYKYLQRNQSVVVKVFQGQLKSTLVCPDCKKVSKIFDPLMYLSLPLPVKKTRRLELVVVYANPNKPMVKYGVVVAKRGTVAQLKSELSELTKIPDDMMVVIDVYNSRFHRIYDNKENISSILDRDDIFVYELQYPIGDPEWVHVPIYHREEIVKQVNNYGYTCTSSYTQRYHTIFGIPTIVRVPRTQSTYTTLYQAILHRCSRYVCSEDEAKKRMAESQEQEDTAGQGEGEGERVGEGEREGEGERGGEGERVGEGEREGEGEKDEVESMDEGNTEAPHGNQNGVNDYEQAQQEATVQPTPTNDNNSEQVKPVSTDNGTGSECSESSDKEGAGKAAEKEEEFQMFKLVVVNSYGSQDINPLPNDGSILRLTSQTYVACDWPTAVKEKCYNSEAALVQEDQSVQEVPEAPKDITLYSCLNLFTETERLGKDDAWYCPDCKDFVQATKKFDLWKLPRVLVIHLKRFSYNRYWRDKLDTFIDFPITGLDLREYVKAENEPEPIYDLFALSNHFGGMGGGHYTAYCKNKSTGKWYNFDDSHVSETTDDRIVSSSAYLLFYCRRDEGKVVHPPLSRTLSQSFADEVQQRRKRFNPSETSHDEETMEQEEAEPDNTEPHPPNNNNTNEDEAFTSSSMNEPD